MLPFLDGSCVPLLGHPARCDGRPLPPKADFSAENRAATTVDDQF